MITEGTRHVLTIHARPCDAGSPWRPAPAHSSCSVEPASPTPPARSTTPVETRLVHRGRRAIRPQTGDDRTQSRDAAVTAPTRPIQSARRVASQSARARRLPSQPAPSQDGEL